jgi:predicted RNA binding protein YcfA (HicA-like mRNA interferase family)
MPRLVPIKRAEFIARLRRFGFEGPFSGGRHEFMIRNNLRLTIPNQHREEISVDLLSRILRQAGIERTQWLRGNPD